MEWNARHVVRSLDFDPRGIALLTAGIDVLSLWVPTTGERIRVLDVPDGIAGRAVFSSDGSRIFGFCGTTLRCWHLEDDTAVSEEIEVEDPGPIVAVDRARARVLLRGDEGLHRLELASCQVDATLLAPGRGASVLSASLADDGVAAISVLERGLLIWDGATCSKRGDAVGAMGWARPGRLVVGPETVVEDEGEPTESTFVLGHQLKSMPDESRIAVAVQSEVRVYSAREKTPSRVILVSNPACLRFSNDFRFLAASGFSGEVCVVTNP